MITDITRFQVLIEEIAYLKTKIREHDTGHIHTTISTLENRVEELKDELEGTKSNGWTAGQYVKDLERNL